MRIIEGNIGGDYKEIEKLISQITRDNYREWLAAGTHAKEQEVIARHEQAVIDFAATEMEGWVVKTLMGLSVYRIKQGISGYVQKAPLIASWQAARLESPANIFVPGGPIAILRSANEQHTPITDLPARESLHLHLGSAMLQLAGSLGYEAVTQTRNVSTITN